MNSEDLAMCYYLEGKKLFMNLATDFYTQQIGVVVYFNQLLNSIGLEKWVEIVKKVGCHINSGVFTTKTKKMLSALDDNYLNCLGCSVNRIRNVILTWENKELLNAIATYLVKGAVEDELSQNPSKHLSKYLLTGSGFDKLSLSITKNDLWEIIFKDRWMIDENGECCLVIGK